jgi:small subunit ribosomal protein S5
MNNEEEKLEEEKELEFQQEESMPLIEKVITITRVAKVVAGGKRLGFNAMVVVGDGNGRVGAGLGKAREVALAITKGVTIAKKRLFKVSLTEGNRTVPYPVIGRCSATEILLKPAAPGTGLIANWVVRSVLETAGVKDVLSKSLRKSNKPIKVVYATIDALKKINQLVKVKNLRKALLSNKQTG